MAGVTAKQSCSLIAAFRLKMRFIISAGVAFCAIIMNGCYQNKQSTVVEFLVAQGIVGVNASNIIHAAVQPALNSDYRNAIYFAELSFSSEQYQQFLTTNAFQSEVVVSLPKKSQPWPKIPKWWNISQDDQKERFSKRVKNAIIVVGRKNDSTYLYGTD